MLGWISVLGVFALVSGVAMAFGGLAVTASLKATAGVLFMLFFLAVAATQLRNRA